MNIELFYTRYQASKISKKMVGWKTRIVKMGEEWAIECNGEKYLRINGFVN